ncbi:alpha/beta fold hydrolase [uncultured Brevundimonas sp.]|uniref:alpha/beta fold hydrolase n=1 Tax=uncultured Brevundimonas sp. TaxID=213418 RepID=UPI0030EC67A9|tara:strand:+ start:1849 stop:3276 length:1428 start_codon:yes stop_codon:yes gene_type:complete
MRFVILAAVATSLAGCATLPRSMSADTDFVPCADADSHPALAGSLCALTRAPLSYTAADAGEVELFVRQFPAEGRRLGQVWLIAGGPGESGAGFYALIDRFHSSFPGHDLMVPDHRGTGRSSRICPEDEAEASPGGRDLAGAEWGTCFGLLESRAAWPQAFTITNAAHDLSGLMAQHDGGGKTFLYGVSYGTQLVLRTMVVAPPARLDGIVLDSLVPPEGDDQWDLSRRSQVVDAVGLQMLARCDADATCRARLGGSAEAAMRAVVDDPALAALFPGEQPKLFFGSLLDSPDARALIPTVIVGVRAGDTGPLEAAQGRIEAQAAAFAAVGATSSIPLVAVISASENNARPDLTRATVAAEASDLLFTSSLPGQLVGGAGYAYPRDAAYGTSPSRLPPVLILQGDLDPKTPLAGARAHADRFRSAGPVRLVTVEDAPHFILLTAPDCAVREMRAFTRGVRVGEAVCSLNRGPVQSD